MVALRALQQVDFAHRLWPEQNLEPKPPFEALYPDAERQAAVEDGLRLGRALEVLWQDPVSPSEVQAEMDRMARESQMPERLAEYWAALGGDPVLVAECLVRPQLTEARARRRFAWDPGLHAPLRSRLEAELARARRRGGALSLSGARVEREFVRSGTPGEPLGGAFDPTDQILVERARWDDVMAALPVPKDALASGGLGPLVEEAEYFAVTALAARSDGRVRTVTWSWPKRSFDRWWALERSCYDPLEPPAAPYRLPEQALHQLEGWGATNTTGAPAARRYHGAVWTGSHMIVWGGETFAGVKLNSGGYYNPATDTWGATSTGSGCPSGRIQYRQALWTGSYMVVWGGTADQTGGRYRISNNTWTAIPATNAPSARTGHSAVWAGQYVVVWGGVSSGVETATGGRYEPGVNAWSTMNTAGAPFPRRNHAAAWDPGTVYGMAVWGGSYGASGTTLNSGGQYTAGDGWPGATSTTGAPSARELATAVWRPGSECIFWGGGSLASGTYVNTGGRWTGNAPGGWSATATAGAPSARIFHAAVWSPALGEMVVWGGQDATQYLATGGRYRPASNAWTALPTVDAPTARAGHSAVSADDSASSRTVVWGGVGSGGATATGGVYRLCSATTSTPVLGGAASTAADDDGCAFSGVRISWPQDPADWADGGVGPRTYEVFRDGASAGAPLAYGTTSFVDVGGSPGVSYLYAVVYANGCGHTAATAGAAASDEGDAVACPGVGDSLRVGASGADAALTWGAVSCGDLAGYRLFGAEAFDAAFPAGWTELASPAAPAATDPLTSAVRAYRVLSADACGNLSGD